MDIQQVLTGAQEAMTARRVFGDPLQMDGVTVLPVAVVGGGGGGGGVKNNEDGGVGFGLSARPAGVFVVRNQDAVWRPVVDVNRIVLGSQLVAIVAMWTMRPLIGWLARRNVAA